MVPFASRTCYLCKAAANKNLEPSWQTWENTSVGHNDRPTLLYSISERYKGFQYILPRNTLAMLLLKEPKLTVEGTAISTPSTLLLTTDGQDVLGKHKGE